MDKSELRRKMRSLQRALPPEERRRTDSAICAHIINSKEYRRAESVFAFVGTDWEIDTKPLLMQALRDGKRLLLPRVREKPRMDAVEISSFSELTRDIYGIPAPASELPAAKPDDIDLVLVPCVAAKRDGFRLGQGGGYYDGFLANYSGTSLLLARECAVLGVLPLEAHDERCSVLVTENGFFYSR